MSGAEALALIDFLANVIQLVDFSCQAFARILEWKEDSSHLLQNVGFSSLSPPLLTLVVIAINTSHVETSYSNELDESVCEALRPVIEDCAASVTKLKAIVDKVAISPNDPGWKKSFKEVAAIKASLSKSLTVINQYQGAYTTLTTGAILKKLTAAVASIPENSDTSDQVPVRHFMVPTIWSDDLSGRQEIMIRLGKVLSKRDKTLSSSSCGTWRSRQDQGDDRIRLLLNRSKDSETYSVFWIHASSLSRVNKTSFEIAESANIPGWDDPKINKLELVSGWLESPRSGRWTLMMDNADGFDLLLGSRNLAKLIPNSSTGAILMKTRDARVSMEFAKRTTNLLGALTLKESITLLESRLGADHNEARAFDF